MHRKAAKMIQLGLGLTPGPVTTVWIIPMLWNNSLNYWKLLNYRMSEKKETLKNT